MPAPVTRIRIPGGQERQVRLDPGAPGTSLAESLERGGIPLNMRCGGRGLCRGCTVEISCSGRVDTVRACQKGAGSLAGPVDWIRIPENSWRDHSLHGVSVFEINLETDGLPSRGSGYGIALDIGTTTLAAALWDFSAHRCLGHGSRPNPQSRYGDNVVSRIHYAIECSTGSADLQRVLVREGLIPLIRELCQSAGIRQGMIASATASGNPTMLHTLAGEALSGLARYPFKPAFLAGKSLRSRDLGFPFDFGLELLPGLGPFVGSDLAVGALASGMLRDQGPILMIDFGTNGEILLSNRGGFLATATAAGPAFEGGRLKCGSMARDGIISSIHRDADAWKWTLSGSLNGDPQGISGAAYVDFLAAGLQCGLLNPFGRFDRSRPDVYEAVSGDDRDWTVNVSPRTFVTEADVAELLQAKAAIGAGVMTLMEAAGVTASDLEKVLVAGGFGYHLDPRNAVAVGLLPDVPVNRIHMVGNASLGGACLLLNDHAHALLLPLIENCTVIELNQMPAFEDNFTDCLALGKMEI